MAGSNYSHDEELRLACYDRALAARADGIAASVPEILVDAKAIESFVTTGDTEDKGTRNG